MCRILLQCIKAVVGPGLQSGHFRPMLGFATPAMLEETRKSLNFRAVEPQISEPQFPPGGPEAPPSVRCSDVQSAQSCAHSPRCSRSIAASSPICLQSRVETVHAEQNISLRVALIFSKIFFQWLAKRYRQPCAVQYSNQLCPEQLGLDVKGRNPILRIYLWCSTDYENR